MINNIIKSVFFFFKYNKRKDISIYNIFKTQLLFFNNKAFI